MNGSTRHLPRFGYVQMHAYKQRENYVSTAVVMGTDYVVIAVMENFRGVM